MLLLSYTLNVVMEQGGENASLKKIKKIKKLKKKLKKKK